MESSQENKRNWKTISLYVFMAVFLLIAVWIFVNLSAGRTTFFGRAAPMGVPDTSNSYVFASPVSARINGDKIRITTFVLDGQGKGVTGKSVIVDCVDSALCQSSGVVIAPIQQMTDNLGQSIWEISASTTGKYVLRAVVGASAIPQTVTVDFR